MTRILVTLIAAASFILPAAAFAQSDPDVASKCEEARRAADERAVEICVDIVAAESAISFAELVLSINESGAQEAEAEERAIRLDLHYAKIEYAENPTVVNFLAVIALQVELNEIREQIAEFVADVNVAAQAVSQAWMDYEILVEQLMGDA